LVRVLAVGVLLVLVPRGVLVLLPRWRGLLPPPLLLLPPAGGAWTLVVRSGRRRGGGPGGAGVAHTHTGVHDESSLTESRPESSTCEGSLSCERAIGHRWSTGTLKGVFSCRGDVARKLRP